MGSTPWIIGYVIAVACLGFVVIHAVFITPRKRREYEAEQAKLKVAAILELKGEHELATQVRMTDDLEDVVDIIKEYKRRKKEEADARPETQPATDVD